MKDICGDNFARLQCLQCPVHPLFKVAEVLLEGDGTLDLSLLRSTLKVHKDALDSLQTFHLFDDGTVFLSLLVDLG